MASYAENVSIWWRHHAAGGNPAKLRWRRSDSNLLRRGVISSQGTLQWRHNGPDGVSNHQPQACLPNRLFRRRSKKTSKLRNTGLCAENSLMTGEFPAQKASNAENVSIWWRHHGLGWRHVLPMLHSPDGSQIPDFGAVRGDTGRIRLGVTGLTHWGRDKMAAISQTTFSNPFSWMKIFEFRLKFHWSLFLRFQLTIFQHWFR